jgi:hypothetical protein
VIVNETVSSVYIQWPRSLNEGGVDATYVVRVTQGGGQVEAFRGAYRDQGYEVKDLAQSTLYVGGWVGMNR